MRFCTKCGATVAADPHAAPPPTPPSAPAAQPVGSFGNAPRPQMPYPGMATPPKQKSGCGKVFLILGIVGLLGVVAAVGGGYYIYHLAQTKIKASESYTLAVAALKENPEAMAKLGAIKETGFPIGSFTENGDGSGVAFYTMSVTGTKTSGSYVVALRRERSRWQVQTGKLTLANGDVINIAATGGRTPDGAASDADNSDDAAPALPVEPPPGYDEAVTPGVLNDQTISKPAPVYPSVAKAVHAAGTVTVEVFVDEQGHVVAAHALTGHPLLRSAAVAAARQARLEPTLQNGEPVKVRGLLTYNFVQP